MATGLVTNGAVRIARPMVSAIFVLGGLDAFRHPASKVPLAEWLLAPLVKRTPGISSTEQIVQFDGAVKVVGGLALATGVRPRWAAVGLAASLIPTTIAGHSYWRQSDPGLRTVHQSHFLKNLALLGALILAAVTADPTSPTTATNKE